MGDEFHVLKIQEFHCSSNRRRYGRMSSFVEQESPVLVHSGKKSAEQTDDPIHKRRPSNMKSAMLFQKPVVPLPIDSSPSRRNRLGSVDSCLTSTMTEDLEIICKHIQEEAKTEPPKIPRESLPLSGSSAFNEETNPFAANPQAGPKRHSSPHLSDTPSPSSTAKTKELKKMEGELKAKLTESLSPSPLAGMSSGGSDPGLEQLAAAATDSASRRPFFLAPFYGSANTSDNIKLWRKAMNDHILHILQSVCIIKKLKAVPQELLLKKSVVLSRPADSKMKTIVFDLDETLAHCVTENISKADCIIQIKLPSGEVVKAGVNIRPHAVDCLTRLAKHFELIIFTASHKFYAEKVVELLDPEKKLFAHVLFRENCIQTENGLYIKDLRVLNRDLKSTVIADNNVVSFAFQLDNGIPIIPFYDEKEDCIMLKITDYLMGLKDVEDVRVQNKANFSLQRMCFLDVPSFLKYYDEDESTEANENDVSGDSIDSSFDSKSGEGPQTITLAQKAQIFPAGIGMRKKTKALVENELGKFKESFPLYLASQKPDSGSEPAQEISIK